MKTLEMAQATAPLAEYAQDISEEPVIHADRRLGNSCVYFRRNLTWLQAILNTG